MGRYNKNAADATTVPLTDAEIAKAEAFIASIRSDKSREVVRVGSATVSISKKAPAWLRGVVIGGLGGGEQ